MKPVLFDSEATGDLVIKATSIAEGLPTDMGSIQTNHGTPSGRFHARITDEDDDKYAWVTVSPSGTGWTNQPTWDSGTTSVRYAVEFNNADVQIGEVVELIPVANADHYVFEYVVSATSGRVGDYGCCGAGCFSKNRAYIELPSGQRVCDTYVIGFFHNPNLSSTLHYISNNIFESETVSVTCDAGSDKYFWRLTIGTGRNDTYLDLIYGLGWSGHRTSGKPLSGSGRCDRLAIRYQSKWWFDPICGAMLQLLGRNRLDLPTDFTADCQVCVYPSTTPGITNTCLENLATQKGRTAPWPSEMFCDASGDLGINAHFRLPWGSTGFWGGTLTLCDFGMSTNLGYATGSTGNGVFGDGRPPADGIYPPMQCYNRYYWTAVFLVDDPNRGYENIFFQGDCGFTCCGNRELWWYVYFQAAGRINEPVDSFCTTTALADLVGFYRIQGQGEVSGVDWNNISLTVTCPLEWVLWGSPTVDGSVTFTFGE